MQRLVIVSNRLPISFQYEDGVAHIQPSSGGLVTALAPILRRSGGLWVGWDGGADIPEELRDAELQKFATDAGFRFLPLTLQAKDVDGFYKGFSNEIIWPLFHDLQTRCNFTPGYWDAYTRVNDAFAKTVAANTDEDDFVWVQDFHLFGLARGLRLEGTKSKLGFFLHIPFPPPDIFQKLPWREDILESLMNYDLVGLQSARDFKNFCACFSERADTTVSVKDRSALIRSSGRECTVGIFPISIDFSEFDDLARTEEVTRRAAEITAETNVPHIALSVDRLDYTKGIPFRIKAFAHALETQPELRRKVVLIQLVVPSRESIPEYQTLRAEIEQLVSQVNGTFAEPGWTPVQHYFRSISREELIAFYLAADVAFVTPLKDGMNLVCKEYCAAHHDERGVLILSEFAGAADELSGAALMVNPYDIEGVASTLARALALEHEERTMRCRALREIIRSKDVYAWASDFLRVAGWKGQLPSTNQSGTRIWERFKRLISVFDI